MSVRYSYGARNIPYCYFWTYHAGIQKISIIIKFSTSDNAFHILWFVHSILVISSYTLVWPYVVNDCAKHCLAKNIFAGKQNFSLNKAKKKKLFCGKFRSMPTFRSTRKGKKCFCDEPTSVWPQGVTLHRIFIKFFFISLGFSRFFHMYFVLQIFGV